MTNTFRAIALALRDYVHGTYDLLAAADAVEAILPSLVEPERPVITAPLNAATYDWDSGRWNFNHDWLVATALSNADLMSHVADGQKIGAIKVLRWTTGCGLKEAKDAVEDERVWTY